MPDEEKVRKKRRKLDSIITKLHNATPFGASNSRLDETQGDEESTNECSGNEEIEERLPRTSRRKLHRAVKQKRTENIVDSKTDDGTVTVNGSITVDSSAMCNGSPVVKKEPVENFENSLAGLEQMLGYNISEEVKKEAVDDKDAKKRQISDSSSDDDDDDDDDNDGLPQRVQCTACGRQVNPAHGTVCRHQSLNVLVCKKCSQYYNSGPFTRDEFGVDEQCRWCADGGSLLCCDRCEKAFCKPCVKRNLGRTVLKGIVDAPEDNEWLCFSCNPKPLSKLIKECNHIMNILETRKAQKTIFKTKKGPSLTGVPNQSERRNRLNSLSENMGLKKEVTSPTKKNFLGADGLDMHHEGKSKTTTKQAKKKSRHKSEDKKSKLKKSGASRKAILVIDEDDDNDDDDNDDGSDDDDYDDDDGDGSDDDNDDSRETKKSKKFQSNNRTKNITDLISDSDEENHFSPKEMKKRTTANRSRDSSRPSESNEMKRGRKATKKFQRKDKSPLQGSVVGSESDSDFVSMVKGRGVTQKKERRQKKSKAKKQVPSDSGETSEDDIAEEWRRKSPRKLVSQKQTRKRHWKISSSESESDRKSDSDVPLARTNQRGKKHKKKRLEMESDEESEEIEQPTKKKSKGKRRATKTNTDSDESTHKKKRKNKGKGKSKKKGRKHYLKEDSNESDKDDDQDDEEVSPSKQKGRKKIRKLIDDGNLAEETRKARRLEEERRKRLLERTRNDEDDLPSESAKVCKLALESDPTTKEPTVEVKDELLQHLKPHQCKGIQFMYDCVIESIQSWQKKEPGGGCILAHCMGLGKTLQVVALVHTLMTHKDINLERVLVIAPLNTVLNWQVEFEKWLGVDDRLEVYILQEVVGNNWRRADMLKHWMRYGGVMIMGYSLYRNLSQCFRIRSKHQKKIFQEGLVDPGPDLVVCDEGHILRNDASAISRALNGVKTRRRIVLTGTPLQNNLIEYHCMVSFVKPNLLGTRREFTNTFVNPIQNGQCADSTQLDVQLMKQRCHVLHKTLEGCVQRKDYSALTPFLPRKHEYVIKVRLSAVQKKLYEHYLKTFVFPDGDVGKRGVSLFSDYQALMRIWTHPWCLKLGALRRPETYDDSDSMDDFVVYSDEEEEAEEEIESVKSTTSEESDLELSSDEEDERAKRRKRRKGNRRQDSSSDEEKDDDDDDDEEEEEEEEGDDKDSDEEVIPQESGRRRTKQACSVVNVDGEDITVVEINNSTAPKAVKKRKVDIKTEDKPHSSKENKKSSEKNKQMIENNGEKSKSARPQNNGEEETASTQSGVSNGNMYGSTRSGTSFKDGASDVEVVEEKEWYDEFLTEEDEFNSELSGKLVLLMEVLADAEAVGDKVLVFSQSLVTLDLIEKLLGGGEIGGDRENWCRGCDYFRMDGSTSATMRQRWADIFNDEDNKNARLFLISTKAGGLGINLVAANRVIVFDVSWNPSHDVQSIFRVYRFGQSKAVYVYRLIAQGTMEEKIYDRQVTKLSMSSRVIDKQQIERHFTAADLRELYNFTPDVLDEEKEKEAEKEAQERPTLPLPKDAVLADLINRLHPKWIVNYLEHDSLLQNIESEELTEEEMKAAWEAYEAEKSGKTTWIGHRRQGMLPPETHEQTQQHVAERIRINAEMLQQIQQIRQLQEMQQRQELEERMQRIQREREQLYQRQRQALAQQHRREEDERRRQNELRFIQHMTQQPVQRLQMLQPTIPHAVNADAASHGAAFNQPRMAYQTVPLQFALPPSLSAPNAGVSVAAPSSRPAPLSNLTGPSAAQTSAALHLPVAVQTPQAVRGQPPVL